MKKYIAILIFIFSWKFGYAQLDCNLSSNQYANTMTVLGVLNIDGIESTDPGDQLVASVNGQCRGIANITMVDGINRGLVYLLVRSNATDGEMVDFSVVSETNPQPVPTNITLEFISDGSYGTTSDPVIFITDPNKVDLGPFVAFEYFTPNGDGYHDTWEIQGVEKYQNFKITIINDHGMRVFEAENYQNDWEGTNNGRPLPTGVYYYILQSNERPEVYKGAFSILK